MGDPAKPRLSMRKMHEGKKVLKFGTAQKLARVMSAKWHGTINAYRCQWNDDGTQVPRHEAHWHTGRSRDGTQVRELTDWGCEIPERSRWV